MAVSSVSLDQFARGPVRAVSGADSSLDVMVSVLDHKWPQSRRKF